SLSGGGSCDCQKRAMHAPARRASSERTAIPRIRTTALAIAWCNADEHWERYTLTIANVTFGFSNSESARKLASLESMTPDSIQAFYAAQEAIDVTPLLPRVAVPTIVIHHTGSGNPAELEWSREVASKIPDARFVTTAAQGDLLWTDEQTRIAEDFLGLSQETPAPFPSHAVTSWSQGQRVANDHLHGHRRQHRHPAEAR